jgi:endonuclease-8
MPEGDTIFRTARTLQRALKGRVVSRFDTHLAQLAVVDRRSAIAGRTILDATPRGKHLLIELSDDLFLRTHMRMQGSWHLYRPGERWRASPRDARIVISTDEWIAIAFFVVEAEFLTREAVARHPRLSTLGPDILADDVDLTEVRRRIRDTPARHIAEAILRQQAVAGLGNVFKSELLFLCGVHPFTAVKDVPDDRLDALLERAQKLMRLNVEENAIATSAHVGRVTTGRLNPREKVWVYRRTGRPCLRCGTAIRSETETEGRRTYWCPTCQPTTPGVVF